MINSQLRKFQDAALLAINSSLEVMNADGSFAGIEDNIVAYYKAPRALGLAGFQTEGATVLRYIKRSFFRMGDFNQGNNTYSRSSANYRNSWLSWGAHTLSSYELSYAAMDYLELAQHPTLGAMPSYCIPTTHNQQLELGTTGAATVAYLFCGRLEPAIKAGEWLIEALNSQPKTEALLLQQDWQGNWISNFPDNQSSRYELQLGESGQTYWYLGIAMAALSLLYKATSEQRFLDAAEEYFALACRCEPWSFEALTAAKVGWGSALLFECTNKKEHLTKAIQVGDMLTKTQTENGWWIRQPAYDSFEGQPLENSLDTSLERACWLLEIVRAIS